MDAEIVKNYFENPNVVSDYLKAAEDVGLWQSERIVIEKFAPNKDCAILELGCGAGRISHGLCLLGYSNITATDFSENMVRAAQFLFDKYGDSAFAEVCDATKICYDSESFDVVVFGFNGLMQIPKHSNRKRALSEIYRVLKKDGVLIFTTHERQVKENADYWQTEQKQWNCGCQNPLLDEFGDIYYKGDYGNIFIHSPVDEQMTSTLSESGFELLFKQWRSDIAQESPEVLDFSDDCIFRVSKKSR